MLINAWIEIRDDFDFNTDINQATLALCGDVSVIPGLYKTRTQGPRSWQLYSLLYDVPFRQVFEQAIELFKSENPGTTDVLGSWHWVTGEQVKDDNVPLYPIPGKLNQFMPDDAEGNPDSTLRDVNLYYGQSPRDFS